MCCAKLIVPQLSIINLKLRQDRSSHMINKERHLPFMTL